MSAQPAQRIKFGGQLTFVDSEIVDSDQELLRRPKWRGGANAALKPHPRGMLRLDVLYVGESKDSSVPTGQVTLADYVRVDVSASWRIWGSAVYATMAVQNLFDSSYEEAVGFPAPGILPRLGLEYRAADTR